VHVGLGELDDAVGYFKEARRIDQGHGDTRGLARAFRRLGDVYFLKGELARAEEAFDQAEDFIKELSDPRERGPLAFSRGVLLASRGQHEGGILQFQAALNDFKSLRYVEQVAETYKNLASCYHAIQDFDEALECMREMGLEQAALWGSLIANLQPDVRAAVDAAYASGKYGQAVQAAFHAVEARLQELVPGRGAVSDKVREWATEERRGLAPFADGQLLTSYQRFVTSAFDILRNRSVHGGWDPTAVDALAAICVAHLIHIWLEADDGTSPILA
jgi:tetratricopeptide (TPR) repeat protein